METQNLNPWNVENLEEFLYYWCPECDDRHRSRDMFLQHALEKHQNAKEYVVNFLVKQELVDDSNDPLYNIAPDFNQGDEHLYKIDPNDYLKYEYEDNKSDVKLEDGRTRQNSIESAEKFCIICNLICAINSVYVKPNPENVPLDEESVNKIVNNFKNLECPNCDFSAKKSSALSKHLNSYHSCEKCHESFCGRNSTQLLKNHRKTCNTFDDLDNKNNLHNQLFTNDTNENQSLPNANSIPHEQPEEYKCFFCENKYNSPSALHVHIDFAHYELLPIDKNSTEVSNQCKICNTNFKRMRTLNCHMKNDHDKDKIEEIKCKICRIDFLSKLELKFHLKEKHFDENGEKAVCDLCGKNFSNLHKLKSHREIVHEGIKKFSCTTCGKSFSSQQAQIKHQKGIHEGSLKKQMCTICGKELSIGGMVHHMKTIHCEDRNELCKFCGKSFKLLSTLKSHIKTVHEGVKQICKHKCKLCDKAFGSESKLNDHISGIHEGIKNHICSHCGAAYASLNGLEFHIRAKHEGQAYNCEKCDKSFNTRIYLKHHIETVHEGKRKYNCEYCGKTFAHKEGMNCHIKTVHEGIRYQCDYCDKSFTQLPNLKKHVNDSHHGIQKKEDIIKQMLI